LPEWECIPTPGHTPGHVSYFRPADRVLISGDAVVTFKIGSLSGLIRQQPGLSGPPWYTTWNRRAVRESIDRLARLRPTVLAGGHGIPMTGAETAAALRAFAGLADPKDKSTLTPQDYSARTGYRPPAAWYQRLNRLGVPLTSLGLAPRDAVTLEVRGRTSGKPRRIPILRTRFRGEDYLVSLSGESQWVRNVRAADGRAVIRRRKARPVLLEELPTVDRPEIIAEYLRAGRARSGAEANAKQARYYFGLGPTPTIDDIRTIADYYPVFRVVYSDDQATRLIGQQAHTKSASIPPEDTGSA
jgi:hypothetical protein